MHLNIKPTSVTFDDEILYIITYPKRVISKYTLNGVLLESISSRNIISETMVYWNPYAVEATRDFLVVTQASNPAQCLVLKKATYELVSKWDLPATLLVTAVFLKIDVDSIFVSICQLGQIIKYNFAGKELQRYGNKGNKENEFNWSSDLDILENKLYICDSGNHRIQILNKNSGEFISQFGKRGKNHGDFEFPHFMALNEDFLYITDFYRVQLFNIKGQFIQFIGLGDSGDNVGEFLYPEGVCVVGALVYVADHGNGRIQIFE